MTHLEIRGCGIFIFGEARITGVVYGLYITVYYNWDYHVPSSYPVDPLIGLAGTHRRTGYEVLSGKNMGDSHHCQQVKG
jgi:hypothetical protein